MNVLGTVLASLVLLCACRSSSHSAVEAENGIAFHNLARGYQTGIAGPGVHVARTADEWRELWRQHASTVIPAPDAPAVDFTRDMVLCVTIGTRPTYGYAVEIVRIAPVDEGRFRVEIAEKSPAPGAITSTIVTQPYHMVVTAKRAGTAELAQH
jgi:hypothetical protein